LARWADRQVDRAIPISPLSQGTLILTTFDLDECLWWL
jgi:hypothetical protein